MIEPQSGRGPLFVWSQKYAVPVPTDAGYRSPGLPRASRWIGACLALGRQSRQLTCLLQFEEA